MLDLANPKHPLDGIKFETALQSGFFPDLVMSRLSHVQTDG